VTGPDGPVRLGGPRQRSLLAVLLLHGGAVVSIDRLAEQLYGEEPPVTAVTQVHRQVSELRRLLGERAIATQPPGYRVDLAPGQLDLDRFERLTGDAAPALAHGDPARAASLLREALALWHGEPLADVAFEPFAPPVAARLRELRLTALEQRIEADLAVGRAAELIGELDALVAQEPLRERLHAHRMLALYRCGRQRDALDAYRTLRAALVDAFGLEPTPPLQELERRILRHDPSLGTPGTGPAPPGPVRAALVVGEARSALPALLRIVEPLARMPERELIAVQLVAAPDDVAGAAAALAAWRGAAGGAARTAAFTSVDTAADVARLQTTHEVELVLLAPAGPVGLDLGGPFTDLAARVTADLAVLATAGRGTPGRDIAVPFAGGAHDWAAAETAAWLALARGEELRLLGARGPRGDASRLLADASLALQRLIGVDTVPELVEPGSDALVAATSGAAAVLVGLPPQWRTEGLGAVRAGLVERAGPPVLVVHRGIRPGALAPAMAATRFSWSAGG
jgi:DNA-binding SARP family transcriptional activator